MYNTVLNSSLLKVASSEYYNTYDQAFNNVSLRIGFIQSIHKIEDKKNVDKQAIEYDVLVFQNDKNKGLTPIVYTNCVTMDSFGGVGDFFEYVKSIPTTNTDKTLKKDDGSAVLLLCIDGKATRGVIIGALPHHNRKSTLKKLDKKHLEGEYNGLRIKVNNDGELIITFKGATDTKGKPKDPAKGGSQFKIEKDGSIELNDRDLDGELKSGNNLEANDTSKAGEEFEKLRIDKTKQSIVVNARKDLTETFGGNVNTTVKGNVSQKMTDLLIECGGKANVTAKGVIDIKTDGALKAKAASCNIDVDDAMQILASSLNVNAQTINLGPGGTPAVILSTQTVGTGNLGAPVISTMMGPFSSTVFIAP